MTQPTPPVRGKLHADPTTHQPLTKKKHRVVRQFDHINTSSCFSLRSFSMCKCNFGIHILRFECIFPNVCLHVARDVSNERFNRSESVSYKRLCNVLKAVFIIKMVWCNHQQHNLYLWNDIKKSMLLTQTVANVHNVYIKCILYIPHHVTYSADIRK